MLDFLLIKVQQLRNGSSCFLLEEIAYEDLFSDKISFSLMSWLFLWVFFTFAKGLPVHARDLSKGSEMHLLTSGMLLRFCRACGVG